MIIIRVVNIVCCPGNEENNEAERNAVILCLLAMGLNFTLEVYTHTHTPIAYCHYSCMYMYTVHAYHVKTIYSNTCMYVALMGYDEGN